MEQGNRGLVDKLGNKSEARKFTRSLTPELLINFVERKEVGEMVSVDSPKANDLQTPILTTDDKTGEIKLQTYLSVKNNTEVSRLILDKLENKYDGFNYIPENMQREMLTKLLEKYEKSLTGSTSKLVGRGTSDVYSRRILNKNLEIFSDRRSGRDITTGMLDKVKIESLRIDSDASTKDQKTALEVFNNQPDEMKKKLQPFIDVLENSLRMNAGKERMRQPSDVLQDIIGKGDLRFTKNRERIYDYWQGIDGKFNAFKNTHEELVQHFSEQYDLDEMADTELAGYIRNFIKYDAKDLQYVFKYESIPNASLDSRDKLLETMDSFLDSIKEKPNIVEVSTLGTASARPTAESLPPPAFATGYRQSEDRGGGQVAEADYEVGSEVMEEREPDKVYELVDLIQDNLINIDFDPLYAYAWKNGQSGFKISPARKNEMKRLRNRLRNKGIRLGLSNRQLNELKRYLDDIDLRTVIEEGDFYLPYQENLIDNLPYDKAPKAKDETIRKYLRNLSKFISAGSEAEGQTGTGTSPRVTQATDTGGFEVLSEGRGTALPSKGSMRSKLPALGNVEIERTQETEDEEGNKKTKKVASDLKSLINEHLTNVKDYFLDPATSDSKPLARRFTWIETQPLTVLSKGRMKGNALVTILGLEMETIGGLLLDEADLNLVVNFLKKLSKNVTTKTVSSFLTDIEDLAMAVDDVFEGDDSKALTVEFGNLAYNLLSRNSIDTKSYKDASGKKVNITFGLGQRKTLKALHEEYKKSKNEVFPFAALYYHVTANQAKYAEASERYKILIKDIKKLEDKLDVIRKSKLETNFLNAHDNIRKMMNKPLYFGISSVDDYEDMQETLRIMKSDFGTDLTAMEVEGIVREIDSMQNLSRKYGISTEGVYYLKAIHR